MWRYFIENSHAYALGIIFGIITSLIIFDTDSDKGHPNDVFYYYGSFIGGIFTLFAAIIAYVAAERALRNAKENVLREQRNYRNILFTEVEEVGKKLNEYITYFESTQNSAIAIYTLGADKRAREKAASCAFEMPRSLYDYTVLSRLEPKVTENAIAFRQDLEKIIKSYYGDNKEYDTRAMYKACKAALENFSKAFGCRVYVPSTSFQFGRIPNG